MASGQPGRGSAGALVRGFCAALLLQCALAATYTVGDDKGWDLSVNYATWAAKYTFKAGDVLVFTYSPMHSVLEVSQSDYARCTLSNAINTLTTGNDSVTLSATKTSQYFICGTPGHCTGGMAVQVTLSSSPAKAPAAAPPKAPAATPPKAPAAAPPKPPVATPSATPPEPDTTAPSTPAAPSPPASSSPPNSTVPSPPGDSAARSSFASSIGAAFVLAAAAAAALF